jgi:hypothetical protein
MTTQATCNFKNLGVEFFQFCTGEFISTLMIDTVDYEYKGLKLHNGIEVGNFIPKLTEGVEFDVEEGRLKKEAPKLYAILKNPERNNFIGQAIINNPSSGISSNFSNVICVKGLQTISNSSQPNKVTIKFNK